MAIISKLLSVYGQNGGCAYDIGCAFSTTLRNSCLGAQAEDLKLRMMVGTFHVDERNYLASLKQPAIRDQLLIRYVQILDDLEAYWYAF